jgi:(S)-ureidoglycine aminohydrolase
MKLIFAILLMVVPICAIAQSNQLGSAVYAEQPPEQFDGLLKRQVAKGKTSDLKELDIYTLTIPAGKTYIPPASDSKFEQLIVVKSGIIKLILKDSAQVVGPGSIALVLAGDKISFQNQSNQQASWYVINYLSVNPANMQPGYGAGPSFIKNWDKLKINKSAKGETRALFDRATTMFERFEIHATALNPTFASHDPHTHRVEEIILMLKGSVLETIGQETKDARAGDCIYLASGVLHRPINNSNEQCYYLAIQWHNLKTD